MAGHPTTRRVLLAAVLSVFLALPAQVQAWGADKGQSGLTVAKDVDPDPDVVEVNLVAREAKVRLASGKKAVVWTYNGVLPGPLIEAEVGDRLVVNLRNELPEPTTIHWHGVEVPAAMDGSNISQLEVPANGGTFRYEFDLLTPALYWYHPHIRSNEQVEKGLAGPLIVRDPDDDRTLGLASRPGYEGDQVLVLDDILLDENGQIDEFATDPTAELEPTERARLLLSGREGNVLLVNGDELPTLKVRPGTPVRWRIVNQSNARFMRLSVPGHTIYRVGGDAGLVEEPVPIEPIELVPDPEDPSKLISDPDLSKGLLLVPGERADVVFVPRGRPGRDLYVEWHDFARGRHSASRLPDGSIEVEHAHDDGKRPPRNLMRLRLLGWGRPGGADYRPPASLRDIPRIDAAGAPPLRVPFGHTEPDDEGFITFFNTMRTVATPEGPTTIGVPFDDVTPADAHDVTVGETYVWEVVNMTGGDHPFHIHGFFFQPLEIEYVDLDHPERNRVVPFERVENKDSIHLPKRPGAKGRSMTILRAVTRFDDTGREGLVAAAGKMPTATTSGGWLAHCHILEHADSGMMTFFELRYPEGA